MRRGIFQLAWLLVHSPPRKRHVSFSASFGGPFFWTGRAIGTIKLIGSMPTVLETSMRTVLPVLILLIPSFVFAAEPKIYRDLPYADPKNERQTLDVYAPIEGKNHP